jgi:SAM-dependent methyltransferase
VGADLWAQEPTKAHYNVFGIDISKSMIDIAQRRVPDAEFRIESLFEVDIPPCEAVTSLGEVLNYLFDPDNDSQALVQLFHRVYSALTPGGVFVFDIAQPGQLTQGTMTREFSEGEDWVVLVEKEENRERAMLTRRIISFRKVGEHYRRADEVHRQRLYEAKDVARELRRIGFRVRTMHSYGRYPLPRAHAAFVARKPAGGSEES